MPILEDLENNPVKLHCQNHGHVIISKYHVCILGVMTLYSDITAGLELAV